MQDLSISLLVDETNMVGGIVSQQAKPCLGCRDPYLSAS